ncbi:MAG: hypothetical protein QM387_06935 [Spirochaetota bacterium]|jgi:hypothetical protein|nr:hypothetical protein [Spirochaetota bacterium]
MKNNKQKIRILKLALLFATVIIFIFSCSTVFTASVEGKVILRYTEEEDGDEIEKEEGLKNALIFLYDNEKNWLSDYNFFKTKNPETSLPNAAEKESYLYYQMTETNTEGKFSFSGFMWKTTKPGYGKTGDRREVYILIYHEDYGLHKNLSPIFIISNATTTIPTFYIQKKIK